MYCNRLDGALDIIAGGRSVPDLPNVMSQLRELYNLKHLAYGGARVPGLPNGHPYVLMTYPHDWAERYQKEEFYLIDPVVTAGRNAFLPFDWSTIDRSTPEAKYLFAESDRYEIGRQGMSIPMRGPHGDTGLFTFTANADEEEWSCLRRLHDGELTMVAHHFHDRVIRLVAGSHGIDLTPVLSRREHQCLQLLADGIPPKQIAIKLVLSEASVRLYLKRVRARMGTANLMQAVVKALRLNLIASR